MSSGDWAAWVSAISAVIAIVVSIVALFKSQKFYTEYALISKDGTVMSHKGFKDYGLSVKRQHVPISDDRANELISEYIIEFAKLPDYFEVSTREGAIVRLTQQAPLEFKLRFVGAGYGSPIIETNFKIQAY